MIKTLGKDLSSLYVIPYGLYMLCRSMTQLLIESTFSFLMIFIFFFSDLPVIVWRFSLRADFLALESKVDCISCPYLTFKIGMCFTMDAGYSLLFSRKGLTEDMLDNDS